eukprot:10232099-Prorocentrum_lima.AAC.1
MPPPPGMGPAMGPPNCSGGSTPRCTALKSFRPCEGGPPVCADGPVLPPPDRPLWRRGRGQDG